MITMTVDKSHHDLASDLDKAAKELPKQANSALVSVATKVRDDLKTGLTDGRFPMPGLSPAYAAERGGGPILVATSGYVDSIDVVQDEAQRVSVEPVGDSPEGIPYKSIGRWSEFGTRTQPPRRHWRAEVPLAKELVAKAGLGVIRGLGVRR